MEKAAKFKLFGVEISVSINDDEVLSNNSTPPEYSSIPTVHHDQNNNVAANYNVLTTLLSSAATTQNPCSEVSRKSPAKKRAFDEIHGCNNSTNIKMSSFKKSFSATIFPAPQVGCTRGANINGQIFSTETLLLPTVQLSTDGSPRSDDDVSRKSPSKKQSSSPSTSGTDGILDDNKVYNPVPLRCFPPTDESELGLSRKKKAKSNIKKNKPMPPILPLEEIPGLMERIGSENGSTKPVFLYKKELVQSDVEPHLNRLFVAGNDKELCEFLTEEEKAAVTDNTRNGIEFVGIDKEGKSYNLRMKNWGSLTIISIIKKWSTMVKANNAQKGDWVELWGYRVYNNELRLVVNFRKSETGSSSSSTSTSNVDGIAILPSPSP